MSALASELSPTPVQGVTGGELAELIRAQSSALGARSYIEHARQGQGLTFRNLEHEVEGWADTLEKSGLAPGTTVGLAIADPVEFSIAFLGTIASGRWAAPLDPSTPGPGMDAALARVQADVVFSEESTSTGLRVEWVDHGGAPNAALEWSEDGVSGGAVLASSGTTGVPKVIPLHQGRLLHTARNVADHHLLTPSDRGFNSLPLFHINAEVVGLLASLVAGSCLVLDDRFHRTRFWELMGQRRITWINAVPAIVSRLATPDFDEVIPSRIRFIRSASAPLPIATSTRFEANTGIPVVETYGMTEAASQITANPVTGVRKPGSVGRPVGVEVRVVPDDSATAEPQPGRGGNVGHVEIGHVEIGHVEIRGPSVIGAYAGHHHGDRFDAQGWLRTGDLGHFDEEGHLYLDSRTDDVINRGGEKVFPREIEELILLDADVGAVAVVGSPDHELGQVPVAYIVLRGMEDGVEVDLDLAAQVTARLRDRLAAALVRSKRPVSLRVVRALPAGATGKVQRRALRESDTPVVYRLDCR
jgi:acyl-CoA synthetase (AMP-forming)/AMP-acid ligase II